MMRTAMIAAVLLTPLLAAGAHAHHSFAVYFDPAEEVTLRGTVTSFRFTNPHGTIVFDVADAQGRVSEWRAETNAPAVLQRRGWSRTSLKPGDVVTIDGWPSRDGKRYIRLRRAVHADGRMVGTAAFGQADQS